MSDAVQQDTRAPWQCPCCKLIWAPWMAYCVQCSPAGQLNDEIRFAHECPLFAGSVDAVLRAMTEDVKAERPPFSVQPRPHIPPKR